MTYASMAIRRAKDAMRTGRDVPGEDRTWADPLYWAVFQLVGA